MDAPHPDALLTLNRAALIARLLTTVAHEVNNALLVISGSAELLEDGADAEELAKALSRITTHSMKAAGAIGELVAFTRDTPEGTMRLNLPDVVRGCTDLRTSAAARRGLTFQVDASGEQSSPVHANRVLLQQALFNLLVNAEQAMAGITRGVIRVETGADGEQAFVRISDAGPGIPAEHRDRIFDPFWTTRDPLESSGLGLFAARHIAERHGGSLALEDVPAGASFVLTLPLAR